MHRFDFKNNWNLFSLYGLSSNMHLWRLLFFHYYIFSLYFLPCSAATFSINVSTMERQPRLMCRRVDRLCCKQFYFYCCHSFGALICLDIYPNINWIKKCCCPIMAWVEAVTVERQILMPNESKKWDLMGAWCLLSQIFLDNAVNSNIFNSNC